MNEARRSRKEMLDWINVVSFAVDDARLFLDSHPDCRGGPGLFPGHEGSAGPGFERIREMLRSSDHRHRRYHMYARGPMDVDQRAVAMAGRGMLIYVEL